MRELTILVPLTDEPKHGYFAFLVEIVLENHEQGEKAIDKRLKRRLIIGGIIGFAY